jgi:FkbM family methyltransferase
MAWQVRKRASTRPRRITYAGFQLACWPDSQSASNIFYFTHRFDHHEMAFLERYLRPGDRALDIGANIGTYSLLMASLVGPEGHIDAFEPMPLAASRLRCTIAENGLEGRITLHEAAVTDRTGSARLLTAHDVSNAVVGHPDGAPIDAGAGEPTIEVATVTLDQVVAPDPRLRVAKLDIEGAEVLALAGAPALLAAARPPVWITEAYDWQLAKLGSSAEALVAAFSEAGFDLHRFDADLGLLAPLSLDEVGTHNVLFIHRLHLEEVGVRARCDVAVP